MSSKLVPGYAPPTVTFAGNSMNVSIPKQATTAKTGEVIFWTGVGLAAFGAALYGISKL